MDTPPESPISVNGIFTSQIGTPILSGTSKSVLFIDSSGNLAQDTNLTWDGSTFTMNGIYTQTATIAQTSPAAVFTVNPTITGTTDQRGFNTNMVFTPSGDITNAFGFISVANATASTHTISQMTAFYNKLTFTSGTTTTAYGYHGIAPTFTTGTVGTIYGMYVDNMGSGSATTAYGLYVASQSGATNNYAAVFAGGNVGIGTTAPAATLEVNGAGSGTIRIQRNSVNLTPITNGLQIIAADAEFVGIDMSGTTAGTWFTRRSGGTIGSPSALGSGAAIGVFGFGGYDGSAWSGNQGRVSVWTAAAWSGSSRPTYIEFSTTPVSSTTLTERMRIDAPGNIVLGNQSALSTSATDGFIYIPTCAGTPTGTPTSYTGKIPMVFDTTNIKLYVYNGGFWKSVTLT